MLGDVQGPCSPTAYPTAISNAYLQKSIQEHGKHKNMLLCYVLQHPETCLLDFLNRMLCPCV